MLYSEIAGAVVDLIVNFALIPRYASVGAAIGTLAAEIVVWVVQFGALKQDIMPAYGCANNLPKPRVINGRESVLDKLRIRQMAREKQKNGQTQEQSATMERNRK